MFLPAQCNFEIILIIEQAYIWFRCLLIPWSIDFSICATLVGLYLYINAVIWSFKANFVSQKSIMFYGDFAPYL